MESIEKHFDIAFSAPGGIKKLRELILSLAMQGKLVQQDPNDQPASELLKDIEVEKRRLAQEGKMREPKPMPEIKPEDVPYELPRSWEWVKLGKISEVNGGFAFKSSKYVNDGVRVVRISDFDERGFKNHKIVRYAFSNDLNQFKLEPNNILMAMTGGTVGKSLLVKALSEPMVVNQRVATIKILPDVLPEFVNSLIQTDLIQRVIHAAKNSTNDNISMGDITGFCVPLPPLPEQKRIVAKIDQLMARCDELENLRAKREQKRLTVHISALNSLLDAKENDSFAAAWDFINRHFGELYSVKENVTELRKAILQLAVMGKLVPQDPTDQPASELLKEIEAEKRILVKEKALRTEANEHIEKDEEYLESPKGWKYCRLGNLARFIDYRGKTPDKVDLGIPLITAKNVRFGYINREPFEYVTEEEYISWMSRGIPKVGDLLFTTEAPLGNIAVIDIHERFALAQRVICFQPHQPEMADYLKWLIMSRPVQSQLMLNATGMTAKGIKASKLKEIPLPVPPLAEQQRIVNKIDQLMALCDQLETQINAKACKESVFLNVVMAKI